MSPRLFLAPLQGVTNRVFRNAYCRYFSGFDIAVAPFIPTSNARRIRESRLRDVLPENNRELPVIPQIMSNNPEDFIFMASRLHDIGHKTVNWNLGCPYPMVTRKKRGAGLLPHTDLLDAFLETVVPSIPNRISVKTRLGMVESTEIMKLFPVFNRYPLAEIIVHPRTADQMYAGPVDLDAFAECLNLSRHPVIYNGDIVDTASFDRIAGRFGEVAGWMIGRGAVADPFLPSSIKFRTGALSSGEKVRTVRAFHDALLAGYTPLLSGPGHLLGRMKEIWSFLAASFENGRSLLKRIRKTRKLDQYHFVINAFFDSEAVWIR